MALTFTSAERTVLRELAKQVAQAAALPIMNTRRRLWKNFNALKPERPMILVYPEGSWNEIKANWQFQCTSQAAKSAEDHLRMVLWTHQHMDTDHVVEAEFNVHKAIHSTGWGLESKWHSSEQSKGAGTFDPVLHTSDDLKKMHFPKITHDQAASEANFQAFDELFGDILKVKLCGKDHISFHLISHYSHLRGLEQTMMDMYECPEFLHECLSFLEEGERHVTEQYLELGLFDLNNASPYHSSGGTTYTDELPAKDYAGKVRLKDLWASAETQEYALVSPQMHEEFALQYEKRLLAPFGLNGYGCCEDLTNKLDYVFQIPNIRRLSMSPWANVEKCAQRLKGDYIFSWKPHPAHLAGIFKPDMIRQYIRNTVEICRDNGCVLEMILKDTHTCSGQPERFTQWTTIARQVVEELGGKK